MPDLAVEAPLLSAIAAWKRSKGAKTPLRLFADGSRRKPRPVCDPIHMVPSVGERHARAGLINSAAIDQVYEIRNHLLIEMIEELGKGSPSDIEMTRGVEACLGEFDVEPTAESIAAALTIAARRLDSRLYCVADQ